MNIELEGICYVVVQCNKSHPISEYMHDLIWYPERTRTLLECVQYRPYVKSIVTENPWIISCYSSEKVRIWREGRWQWPDNQTYGYSVNGIMCSLIGLRQTIPSIALDGGTEVEKLIEKLENSYKVTQGV